MVVAGAVNQFLLILFVRCTEKKLSVTVKQIVFNAVSAIFVASSWIQAGHSLIPAAAFF